MSSTIIDITYTGRDTDDDDIVDDIADDPVSDDAGQASPDKAAPGQAANSQAGTDELDSEEEVEELDLGAEDSYASAGKLFKGDRGVLPLEARICLRVLLKGPYVDRNVNRDNWNSLIKYEEGVRSWLGEIFLDLVLDEDLGVGFIREADISDRRFKMPNILREKPLNFFESLLLIHLRQRLSEAELQGRSPTITKTEMMEYLNVYESKSNTDHARFENRVLSAITNMRKKFYLLRLLTAAEETYTISPVLKLILSPDAIRLLILEYQNFKYQGLDLSDDEVEDDYGPDDDDAFGDDDEDAFADDDDEDDGPRKKPKKVVKATKSLPPQVPDGAEALASQTDSPDESAVESAGLAEGEAGTAPEDPPTATKRRGRPRTKPAPPRPLFSIEGIDDVKVSIPLDELEPGDGDDGPGGSDDDGGPAGSDDDGGFGDDD
ncbi:MAG: DUF4194 domain-containing protein [Deltaproteobacteria bacterium]|jgi:hypothetical protein|nr:DUF4194 domain-containing protein [Deltaproteobacteria bacterium]